MLRLGVVVERIGVGAVLLGAVAVLRVAELGLVVVMRLEFELLPVELLRLGVVAVVVWDEELGVVEVDEDERFVVAEVVEDERLGVPVLVLRLGVVVERIGVVAVLLGAVAVLRVAELGLVVVMRLEFELLPVELLRLGVVAVVVWDERIGVCVVVEDERFVLAAVADEDLLSVVVEREVLPDERETVVVDREAVEDWDEDALVEVVLLCAIPGMTAASDTAIAKRAVVVFFIVRQ